MPSAPLPPELVEFLQGPHAAVVSTVRSNGAPYSAATWYDWEDGRILLNMDAERLRLTHMRRDPRVAIAARRTRTGSARGSPRWSSPSAGTRTPSERAP